MKVPEIELRDQRFQDDRYGYIDEIRAEHAYFHTQTAPTSFSIRMT